MKDKTIAQMAIKAMSKVPKRECKNATMRRSFMGDKALYGNSL